MTTTTALPPLSEETIERLRAFEALVQKWSPKINLVSKKSLSEVWQRHIVDSIQLYEYAPENALRWADFGSGGGFPGVVLAIMSRQLRPEAHHVLVESDQRKATFLREAMRVCSVNGQVLSERIEAVPPLAATVVTARALAPLNELFGLLSPHMTENAVAILPKGGAFQTEIDLAAENWDFRLSVEPSKTEPSARILRVSGLTLKA